MGVPSRSISFNGQGAPPMKMKPFGSGKMIFEGSLNFTGREMETKFPLRASLINEENMTTGSFSPISIENNAKGSQAAAENNYDNNAVSDSKEFQAAVKLQKVYKSFRTRRQLADCAVMVEQRWWRLLDFAELKRSSITFFEVDHPESAVSKWSRARKRAAKLGKGLSKDERARKLALQHWLEAIDPRHRYGHNLQFYYANWLQCQSKQPFFYWLDIGEGREVNLVEKCSRSKLQQQCIKYLCPKERSAYEISVEDGKFYHKQSGKIMDTRGGPNDTKWIFVLSASKILYAGFKQKGTFQHSSFLAGGATLSAGRLVVEDGILKAVWPHSGHYHPTNENFEEFMSFLEQHNVDLSIVQKSPTEEEEETEGKKLTFIKEESNAGSSDILRKDSSTSRSPYPPLALDSQKSKSKITPLETSKRDNVMKMFKHEERRDKRSSEGVDQLGEASDYETADEELTDEELSGEEFELSKPNLFDDDHGENLKEAIPKEKIIERLNSYKEMKSYQFSNRSSCKWTTGAGARIGCMRDYPSELQNRALEEVLSQ